MNLDQLIIQLYLKSTPPHGKSIEDRLDEYMERKHPFIFKYLRLTDQQVDSFIFRRAIWLHEMAHYATARILGIPARIEGPRTYHGPTTNLQNLLITSTPILLGLPFILGSSWMLMKLLFQPINLDLLLKISILTLLFSFSLVWMLGCGFDFIQIGFFLLTGRWPEQVLKEYIQINDPGMLSGLEPKRDSTTLR
jgi:hypothetical protein